MTILKKPGYLLLTTLLIFACEDQLPTVTQPLDPGDGVLGPVQFFNADLEMRKVSGHPIEYEPVLLLQVAYEGYGTSNMMSNPSLEASHVEEIIPGNDSFSVGRGEFILRGDGGHSIYGSYQGHGTQDTNELEVTWTLKVEGGAGKFSSAQGILTVVITDPNRGNAGSASSLRGQITGNIRSFEQF